ncbi:MAG: hypothetical protein ACYC9Q_14945 [Bacillota bacterium]
MSGRGLAGMVALAAGCFVLAVLAVIGLVAFTQWQFHHAWREVMQPW